MSAVPDEAVAAFIAAATPRGAAPITARLDAIRAGLAAAAKLIDRAALHNAVSHSAAQASHSVVQGDGPDPDGVLARTR